MKTLKRLSIIAILILIVNIIFPLVSKANYISNNVIENINAITESNIVEDNIETKISNKELEITYRSHVQDMGWQDYVSNGEQSGTTGKNLKIEAMNISLLNNTSDINIKYATYVQGKGWQKTVSNGEQTGTTGSNLRMEAIKIWLDGTDQYSVTYRVHVQDIGWTDWVYDGEISGNLGDNKKIEAIEIKIVSKVEKDMYISYSSHVQDIGWQEEKEEYDISGTIGNNKKIEGLKINLINAGTTMSISYKAYVENRGWQNWVQDGKQAGTIGKNLKIYGIRIKLEGTSEYSVQYRVHVQDIGWMNWVKNGEVAGKISDNKKIEAIQIKLVKKDNEALTTAGVEYYTYLRGSSSNENKIEKNGEISGTTGENRIIEGINIELLNAPEEARIKYKAHVQDIGWMNWVSDGDFAGIFNGNKKIEAIQIELENLDKLTVEYKVHVQDLGWTDWYIDGEIAGTTGKNKKIEAIQIRLVSHYERCYKGIDVSKWNGEINWAEVKNQDIDFAIARIGYGRESYQKDHTFEVNYSGAKSVGIKVGTYLYSYAKDVEGAKLEAYNCLNWLNGRDLDLPVFYDLEDDSQLGIDKQTITDMAKAFCEILHNAGYKVGVYANKYWLQDKIDVSQLPEYCDIWLAHYTSATDPINNPSDYKGEYQIWQYTSSGNVSGINGNVDMNLGYKKY